MDRERLKAIIVARYSPRVHMSMILAACGLTCMLTSWSLLHFGVTSMLARYPVALAAAYGMFLLGVWVWIRVTDVGSLGEEEIAAATAVAGAGVASAAAKRRKAKSKGGSGDWSIDLPSGGGGSGGGGGIPNIARGAGSFDGGGASGGWGGAQSNLVGGNISSPAAPEVSIPTPKLSGGGGGKGGGFSLDLDGEALVVLLLAAVLIALIAVCSGYLIWTAPDVLAEAAFGAALTGTLARPTKQQTPLGWVSGVVKKTWWPFAVVLVAASCFAYYAGKHFPQAHTFRQAIAAALDPQPEKP